eukprot:Rmarinus@m.16384
MEGAMELIDNMSKICAQSCEEVQADDNNLTSPAVKRFVANMTVSLSELAGYMRANATGVQIANKKMETRPVAAGGTPSPYGRGLGVKPSTRPPGTGTVPRGVELVPANTRVSETPLSRRRAERNVRGGEASSSAAHNTAHLLWVVERASH